MKKMLVVLVMLVIVMFTGCSTFEGMLQETSQGSKPWIEEVLEEHNPGEIWISSEEVLVSVNGEVIYKNIPVLHFLEKEGFGGITFLRDNASSGLLGFAMEVLKSGNTISLSGLRSEIGYASNGDIYAVATIAVKNLIFMSKGTMNFLMQNENKIPQTVDEFVILCEGKAVNILQAAINRS